MKKIIVFCSAGLSTSLLVSKMRKAAEIMQYECEIEAYGINEIKRKYSDADVILLGPQIKFDYERVKKIVDDKPLILLDSKLYGTFDGRAVLNLVLDKLETKV